MYRLCTKAVNMGIFGCGWCMHLDDEGVCVGGAMIIICGGFAELARACNLGTHGGPGRV